MFTGILLMFLLAMALVLFFVYYQRRFFQQQASLERQRLEEQKKLLKAEITVQEKERARIAHDLHDEVGALLSAVKLHISAGQINPALPAARKTQVESMLDDAVQRLRDISQNLLPQNLLKFGLVSATEQHCRQLENTGVFAIHFTHNLRERLHSEQELLLYRIIQELLNNTLKHARATDVTLELYQQSGKTCLLFSDNGIGFTPEENDNGQGLGRSTLSSRVQLLQGEMKFISALGKGVQITVIF